MHIVHVATESRTDSATAAVVATHDGLVWDSFANEWKPFVSTLPATTLPPGWRSEPTAEQRKTLCIWCLGRPRTAGTMSCVECAAALARRPSTPEGEWQPSNEPDEFYAEDHADDLVDSDGRGEPDLLRSWL